MLDRNLKLSPHFHLSEMTVSQTAARMGRLIDPDPGQLEALIALCEHILEPVRLQFGVVIVSSGLRPAWLNAELPGTALHSQHMEGKAADFTCPGHSVEEVTRWLANSTLPFDQLIYEFGETGWTHVSYDAARMRRQVLTAQAPTTVTEPTRYLGGIVLSC